MSKQEKLMIYGRHPVEEALSSGESFDKILVQRNNKAEWLKKIKINASRAGIPVQNVPVQKLNNITRKNHQGVIGILSPVKFYKIEQILPQIYENGEDPLFIILDEVTDVRNMGAIARSGVAFGVHALIIPEKGSARITPEAVKASSGALHKIFVCREKRLTDVAKTLKLNGIKIIALDSNKGRPVNESDISLPAAILLGAEGKGISNELSVLSDQQVKIPISEEVDSLNVSVTAGIILYVLRNSHEV